MMRPDYFHLQHDLINTIGIAMHNGVPMAVIDLSNAERDNIDPEELCHLAREYGLDPDDYLVDDD